MTDLKNPVRRRTKAELAAYDKRIVVSLEPGDVISMHLERSRTKYSAPISKVFYVLAQWHADAEMARRREERKQKGKS